jgi:regulator of nucleoside diphosphate kinase
MTLLKSAQDGKMIVTQQDRGRLREAIQSARRSWSTYGPYLDWLQSQLNEAQVVASDEVPRDVVTMNSRVDIEDLRTGEALPLTLVYPDHEEATNSDAGLDSNAGPELQRRTASIFDPTGLALLGRRVGDMLSWQEAEGARTARVADVPYQPESAGDEAL